MIIFGKIIYSNATLLLLGTVQNTDRLPENKKSPCGK